MKVKQFVSGQNESPQVGQTVFKSDFLKNVVVHFLIVDNVPEHQLNPDPCFRHNSAEGTIDRAPNIWTLNNKLIVVYSECEKC